ncbi:Kynurenine formamidase [Burkholderia sp. AU4i]|nr:Kynurenine formamidase [Burkholderia sp. AU4i]
MLRRSTLAGYLWHAFVGYWIVPAAFLFACGVVIALIRRVLRRPPIKPPVPPVTH